MKYNDPIYVKLEKLDIMIRLCTPGNIGNVLSELKEYVRSLIVHIWNETSLVSSLGTQPKLTWTLFVSLCVPLVAVPSRLR